MALTAIYQYRNTTNGLLRFFYTTLGQLDGKSWNSPPKDDVANWSLDGIAFYGCAQTDPNAMAVYQYYAPLGGPPTPPDAQKYYYINNTSQEGGWYLSSTTPAFYVYAQQDGGLAQFTQWYINEPQYSYFIGCNVQAAVTGNFLAPAGWGAAGWTMTFYALPGQVQLSYALPAIQLSALPEGEPRLMGQQLITNNSKYASIAQDVSYSLTLSSSFTLSLSETISDAATQNIEIGIPDLGSMSETLTITVTLSSTQSQTTTTSQTASISSTVNVPPTCAVQVYGNVYVLTNYSQPVSVVVVVSTESNGVALNAAAPAGSPCQALIDLFQQQQASPYPGTITPEPQIGAIQLSLNANMTCSFGVDTELVVNDSAATSPGAKTLGAAGA